MLNRTLLVSVITAVVFTLSFVNPASSVKAADEKAFFHTDDAVFLGQSPHDARRTPSLGEQFRRWVSRILPDDSPETSPQRHSAVAVQPAVPTTPPRPLTAEEIRQSTSTHNQTQRTANTGSTSQQRAGMGSSVSRTAPDDSDTEIHDRMNAMRSKAFSHDEVLKAAEESRQQQRVAAAARQANAPLFREIENTPGGIAGGTRDMTDVPNVPMASAMTDKQPEFFAPIEFNAPRDVSRAEPAVQTQPQAIPYRAGVTAPARQSALPSVQNPVRQSPQTTIAIEPAQQATRQVILSASPQLTFEIEKPPSAIVGQEIVYRIRATNVGDVAAERVVLNVEIPPWIVIRHTDADNGNWVLLPRSDGSGVVDLEWRVNRINQGETNLLALRLVSQQHRAIELSIQYNFHRPVIVAPVEVQEPKLAMELIGPDEVRWNDFVTYTLVVRNVGNGSAEKLKFELSQTSSESQATSMEEPLLPGEGQEIPILVRAGREQEQIDIGVVATGAHDLKSEVRRRIKVLRPRLEMSVHTSPMHFVDEPAEMQIRVINHGNADAENVSIRAELPLGAQHVTSSEGWLFVQQQQQNIIEWRGRSIPKGEMQTFTLTCVPKREGECRVSVEVCESNGTPLASNYGTFMAEAIVELNLAVLRPNRPIELGEEVTYTVEITNNGTKSAEDVEISMMFGEQLEPIAVAGRDAHYTGDGQVIFEKVPVILPKQCVTLRVSVEAKSVGTAQIRAEVVRADASGASIRLEQGLSAHIFSRQKDTATASGQTTQK